MLMPRLVTMSAAVYSGTSLRVQPAINPGGMPSWRAGGGAETGSLLFEEPTPISRDRRARYPSALAFVASKCLSCAAAAAVLLLDHCELVSKYQHVLALWGAQAVLLGCRSGPPLVCADQFIDPPILVGNLVALALDVHEADEFGPNPRHGEHTHHDEDLRSIGREQTD